MLSISNGLMALFSLFMAFFSGLPWTGMIVISVVTGVIMLVIYKYTSNQAGITRAKDRIKANFLAIMLFNDSLRVLVTSIGRIFKWNGVYMAHNLRPLAVMIVPVLLLLVQINFWYGYRPVEVGEQVIVTAHTQWEIDLSTTEATLQSNGGVVVETPAVRIPNKGEVAWRIRGQENGEYELTIHVGEAYATKRVVVGTPDRLYRLAPLRHNGNFFDALLYPGEKKLNGPISFVSVDYPTMEMNLFGWNIHWIIAYFILSILFGFSMKGIFKVDI